jgi:hypothetical protein
MSGDEERPRGRYAVRFRGEITKEATRALRTHYMGLQRRDTFFSAPVPYSTTVVVRASSTEDAIARVRQALEPAGTFSGFEAAAFGDRKDDAE